MKIGQLSPQIGSTKKSKRIGRGPGSGHGKTATKGHKGQSARSGSGKGAGFEGGQTPLQRRLPKRGFKNYPFKKEYAVLNLEDINNLSEIPLITPDILIARNVIKDLKSGLKILATGELTKAITVHAHSFSAAAVQKLEAAGGKAELIK